MISFAKKSIFFLWTILALLPISVRADGWGTNQAAAIWTFIANQSAHRMEGIELGALKMTAFTALNQQINQLIGGVGGGGPRFVTDWREELFALPEVRTRDYMNDAFTLTTRGMGSSANYISATDYGIGNGGNYARQLEARARATIYGDNPGTVTIQNYGGVDAIDRGDWGAFRELVANPLNNPLGYSLTMEQVYQKKLEEEKKLAEVRSIANQGFKGTSVGGDDNKVSAPGILLKDLYSNAQDLPNKIIAGATNPTELAGSLVAAQLNKAMNNLVQQGVGTVQAQILSEMRSTAAQADALINGATQVLGPGARFLPDIQREATIKFRAATKEPIYGD